MSTRPAGYAHLLRAPRPVPKIAAVVDGELHVSWVVTPDVGPSAGACDPDRDNAVRRALGEYAERLSHLAAAELLPILPDPGSDAAVAATELVASVSERPRNWVLGRGLRTGTPVAVPAQAVLLGWDPPAPEPRWWVQTSVGTAAAAEHDQARAAALREVVERHTLGLGWRTGDIRFEDLSGVHETVLPPGLLAALRRHGWNC